MLLYEQQVDKLIKSKRYEIMSEGLLGGLFKKRKQESESNSTEKKSEEQYTESQYNTAVSWLKYYIEEEAYKEPFNKLDPRGLAYCGITYAQFKSDFNKHKNDKDSLKVSSHNSSALNGILDNYEEGSDGYNLFSNNEFYYLFKGSESSYYFPKLQKFYVGNHDDSDISMSDLKTYEELVKEAKEDHFTLKQPENSSNKIHNQYVRAYIAADKNLGYNKLSSPE